MRGNFKKFVAYLLAATIIMPLWLLSGLLNAKPAMAATSVSGGGGSLVNGTGNFNTLNPLIVTSNNLGDIDSIDGIKVRISNSTSAALKFDTTLNSVTADPSSDLDLGLGAGTKVMVTPTADEIIIPVVPAVAPADSYVTISNIRIHATDHGTTAGYKGKDRIRAVTNGGTSYGLYFEVDAQDPTITDSNIDVTGNNGIPANTFIKNDSVAVAWSNTTIGDNNNDLASVGIDFSQYGGPVISAVNNADIWEASYLLLEGLNLSDLNVNIMAIDFAGNSSTKSGTLLFDVDTQSPIITITRVPDKDFSNSSYSLTVDFGDATSLTEIKLDSGLWESYAGPISVSSEGNHIFYAQGTDNAGNTGIAQVNFSIGKTLPSAPTDVKVDKSGKRIDLSWTAVGGDVAGYIVTIDGVPVDAGNVSKYSTELNYGSHTVLVTSYDKFGNGGLNDSVGLKAAQDAARLAGLEQSFILNAPVQASATVTRAPAIIAPASAQAAPATVEQPAEQPTDEGQIKGEETTPEETTDEKINWTPWIILFVLIVLAGAATGGYFYWFAGDDEAQAVVKPDAGKVKKTAATAKGKESDKKPRRW